MIDFADYTPDGKFLVLRNSFKGKDDSDLKVPVSLLDELLERRLSSYELGALLLIRSETVGRTYRKVRVSELVGEDLTGKTVGIYDRNYEDSRWISSENPISVTKDEHGMHCFVFPEEWATCWDGECKHLEDGGDGECPRDDLQGMNFYGSETVLVSEKEAV